MERVVRRQLPDGTVRYVQPFHVSLEGLETSILCRDDDDYDAMVKIICVCARRKNVILVIYTVVSNHCHAVVLATRQEYADSFAVEVKRMTSMWVSKRYGTKGIMKGVDAKALFLDNNWYVRNALAYVPRNALDNGCNVYDYPWSGFRAMFSANKTGASAARAVASLTRDEKRELMHTADRLEGVGWLLDNDNRLIPGSICDHEYLEQVFDHDQAFFLKTIGGQNSSEMRFRLIDSPRKMAPDGEFMKMAQETSTRWFGCGLDSLSVERKIRIIPYLNRTNKTTVPQLARVFNMDRDTVKRIISKKGCGKSQEAS